MVIFPQGASLQRTPLSMLSLFCPTAEMWQLLSSQPRHLVVGESDRRSGQLQEKGGGKKSMNNGWISQKFEWYMQGLYLFQFPFTTTTLCWDSIRVAPLGRHIRQCPPCWRDLGRCSAHRWRLPDCRWKRIGLRRHGPRCEAAKRSNIVWMTRMTQTADGAMRFFGLSCGVAWRTNGRNEIQRTKWNLERTSEALHLNAQFLLGFQQQMDALKDEDVKEVPALPESRRVSALLHCIFVFPAACIWLIRWTIWRGRTRATGPVGSDCRELRGCGTDTDWLLSEQLFLKSLLPRFSTSLGNGRHWWHFRISIVGRTWCSTRFWKFMHLITSSFWNFVATDLSSKCCSLLWLGWWTNLHCDGGGFMSNYEG